MNKQILLSYIQRVIYLIIMPVQINLLTNNLTVESYGLFNLVINTGVVLTILFSLGVQHYQSITIPKYGRIKQVVVFKNLFLFQIVAYLLFSVAAYYLLVKYQPVNLNPAQLKIIIIMFLIYLLFNEIGRFYSYIHKVEVKIILHIIEQFLLLSILIAAINYKKTDHLSLSGLLYVYLATYSVILLIYLVIYKEKLLFLSSSINKNVIKKAIMFGIPMIVTDLIWRLMQNTDSYFLVFFKYDYDLGIYSFVIKIANVAYLAASPFLWVMFPYIVKASGNGKESVKLLEKQLKMTCIFIVAGLGVFLINVESLIGLVANEAYLENMDYYYIVSLYPLFLLFVYVLYQQLMIIEKKHTILISYLTGLVVNAIFSYLLIENYKVYGAITSTLAGLSVTLAIMLLNYENKHARKVILSSFTYYTSVIVVILAISFLLKDILLLNGLFILYVVYMAFKNNLHIEVKELLGNK